MKSTIAIAALIGVAFAASSVFAQNSGPGSTLPKPNKVTSVPPPSPPGPDKLVTHTQPTRPELPKPKGPRVVDDFSGGPNTQASKCYANLGHPAYFNCINSLITNCVIGKGGTASSGSDQNGGYFECNS